MVKENRTTVEKIDLLNSINTLDYNILKLAEEATELTDVLIKMVTKPNRREERMAHLIEELGDVRLRSEILIQKMGILGDVQYRISSKLDKLVTDADAMKYTSY